MERRAQILGGLGGVPSQPWTASQPAHGSTTVVGPQGQLSMPCSARRQPKPMQPPLGGVFFPSTCCALQLRRQRKGAPESEAVSQLPLHESLPTRLRGDTKAFPQHLSVRFPVTLSLLPCHMVSYTESPTGFPWVIGTVRLGSEDTCSPGLALGQPRPARTERSSRKPRGICSGILVNVQRPKLHSAYL